MLREQLENAVPTGPGVFGLLRGCAQHEAELARWTHTVDRADAAKTRVAKHLVVTQKHLQPDVPGYGSPASKVAMKRVTRRHPELVHDVQEYAAWRRADEGHGREDKQRARARDAATRNQGLAR